MTNAELIEALRTYIREIYDDPVNTLSLMWRAADALEAAEKRIADLETALAACRVRRGEQLPKEGEWIIRDYDMNTYKEFERSATDKDDGKDAVCSVCGYHALMNGHEDSVHSNYCPNFGVRMKGDQEGER